MSAVDGLRLTLSWLTIFPIPARTVDERSCGQAIALAPATGALLGGCGALLLWVLSVAGAPALLAGACTVGASLLLTRGMHVDGLADTVDGLGCYGPPDRALRIMREGGTGPFAVVALILLLGIQVIALGELATQGHFAPVILAGATGRAGFLVCCRRGQPAARPEGMGALVASSQSRPVLLGWWLALLTLGAFVIADAWWLGVTAVAIAGLGLLLFTRHVRHRLGGVTGDVLGAASEVGSTIVLALCSFG